MPNSKVNINTSYKIEKSCKGYFFCKQSPNKITILCYKFIVILRCKAIIKRHSK
jgi:hypothetical protein